MNQDNKVSFFEMPKEIQLIIWDYYSKDFYLRSEIGACLDIPLELCIPGHLKEKAKKNRAQTWQGIVQNIWTLEAAIERGENVDEYKGNTTALIQAAISPYHNFYSLAVVKKLLAMRVNVNKMDRGKPALIYAVECGLAPTVEALLIHGGISQEQLNFALDYINRFNSSGLPIELRLAILRMLLKAGATKQNPLSTLVADMLEKYIRIRAHEETHGTILPSPLPLFSEFYGNGRLLHKQYTTDEKLNRMEDSSINEIFRAGFKPIVEDPYNNALLSLFIPNIWVKEEFWIKNIDILKLARFYGIKINNKNLLIEACAHKNGLELVKLLLEDKADVNAVLGSLPPLLVAIDNNLQQPSEKIEMIKQLLESSADVNYRDKQDRSVLRRVVQACPNIEVIRMLINFGAKVVASYAWAVKNTVSLEIKALLENSLNEAKEMSSEIEEEETLIAPSALVACLKKFFKAKQVYDKLKTAIQTNSNSNSIDPDKIGYSYLYKLNLCFREAEDLNTEANNIRLENKEDTEIGKSARFLEQEISEHQQNILHLDEVLNMEIFSKLSDKYKHKQGDYQIDLACVVSSLQLAEIGPRRGILLRKQQLLLQVGEQLWGPPKVSSLYQTQSSPVLFSNPLTSSSSLSSSSSSFGTR